MCVCVCVCEFQCACVCLRAEVCVREDLRLRSVPICHFSLNVTGPDIHFSEMRSHWPFTVRERESVSQSALHKEERRKKGRNKKRSHSLPSFNHSTLISLSLSYTHTHTHTHTHTTTWHCFLKQMETIQGFFPTCTHVSRAPRAALIFEEIG